MLKVTEPRRSPMRIAAVTMPLIVGAGWLSGWLAGPVSGDPWYEALTKPTFMPPAWLFGVVWPVLYAMLGMALALVLAEPASRRRTEALALFYLQLGLNLAWSPVFFGGHDIGLGKMLLFVMAAIAAAAAGQFWRLRPLAGGLMLPYLGWLIFAASLNAAIHALNPGAGRSLLGL